MRIFMKDNDIFRDASSFVVDNQEKFYSRMRKVGGMTAFLRG